MIVPNLMVSDMVRSVRFYRDILGMTLTMTVSPEREVGWPGDKSDAAFAVLEWDGAQLMLQTVESLTGELAVFAPDHAPAPSGTIYFRRLHPGSVHSRVAAEDIVKGPERSWYGMMELYVRDPDGYVTEVDHAPYAVPGFCNTSRIPASSMSATVRSKVAPVTGLPAGGSKL